MIHPSQVVSIHPYFKVKPGKLDEVKGLLEQFMTKTGAEAANLYYDFTIHGEVLFCREAYVGADGLLKHLDNVGGATRGTPQSRRGPAGRSAWRNRGTRKTERPTRGPEPGLVRVPMRCESMR